MTLLTAPGWPRPRIVDGRHDGLPVPWISPEDALGKTDPDRHTSTLEDSLCQVCGEGWGGDEEVWLFVNEAKLPARMDTQVALAMDDAIMHPRCAQLTLEYCPVIRGLRGKGQLQVLKTAADHVHREDDDDDRVRLAIDGEHLELAL